MNSILICKYYRQIQYQQLHQQCRNLNHHHHHHHHHQVKLSKTTSLFCCLNLHAEIIISIIIMFKKRSLKIHHQHTMSKTTSLSYFSYSLASSNQHAEGCRGKAVAAVLRKFHTEFPLLWRLNRQLSLGERISGARMKKTTGGLLNTKRLWKINSKFEAIGKHTYRNIVLFAIYYQYKYIFIRYMLVLYCVKLNMVIDTRCEWGICLVGFLTGILQDGPLLSISRLISPLIGAVTPATHL